MHTRPTRLKDIPGIGVDRLGNAADALADPSTLRLENLDTDLRPWPGALEATRAAIDDDAANSYLPFLGQDRLRQAAAAHVFHMSGVAYDWRRCCAISAGGLSGILNVLLATLEPGDEVILTGPIYAGLLNRVRLAGGVPRLARLEPGPEGWRLDLDSFRAAAAGDGHRYGGGQRRPRRQDASQSRRPLPLHPRWPGRRVVDGRGAPSRERRILVVGRRGQSVGPASINAICQGAAASASLPQCLINDGWPRSDDPDPRSA